MSGPFQNPDKSGLPSGKRGVGFEGLAGALFLSDAPLNSVFSGGDIVNDVDGNVDGDEVEVDCGSRARAKVQVSVASIPATLNTRAIAHPRRQYIVADQNSARNETPEHVANDLTAKLDHSTRVCQAYAAWPSA